MSNEFDAENEIGVGGTLQVDTPQQPPQQESKTGSQISMFEESSAKSETAAKPATKRRTSAKKVTVSKETNSSQTE